MSKMTHDEVVKLVSDVKLPGQRQNITEARLLQHLEVQESSVLFRLQLPEENPTFERSLRYQIQKAVHEKFPTASVVVEFQVAHQQQKQDAQRKPPRIGTIIAVGSGKGGVGKSSVTVNLATALKKLKYKVGILDCDIYGPSIPTLMGVEGKKPLVVDNKIQPIEAHGMQLMSAGFFVEEGQGLVWRGPMIHKLISQFYWDVNWDNTDVLLIDLPPGTGDAPLSLAQNMPLTGAVLVSLPQKLSLIDVHKAAAMFQHLKVPIFGIVENMSEYVCESCGEKAEIFPSGGVNKFAQELGLPVLGNIPIDPRLRRLSDEGKPYLLEFEDTAAGQSFMELAKRLQPMLKTADDWEEEEIVKFFKQAAQVK